jgi:hypothetical protein
VNARQEDGMLLVGLMLVIYIKSDDATKSGNEKREIETAKGHYMIEHQLSG